MSDPNLDTTPVVGILRDDPFLALADEGMALRGSFEAVIRIIDGEPHLFARFVGAKDL